MGLDIDLNIIQILLSNIALPLMALIAGLIIGREFPRNRA